MDSITHLTQKLLAERARQALHPQPAIPDTAPPPYTASSSDSDSDSDSDESDEVPVKLTINAPTSIHGSNNLVPTASPLSDATKFSALLLHAVNRINAANVAAGRGGEMKVDLTINCGVTVIGDRNVVGPVAIKLKGDVGVGAKRKAGESLDDERRSKRSNVSTEPEA